MTPDQIQASLSTLSRLQAQGSEADVSRICGRLLALYPSQGPRSESVVEDWVRKLISYPLASIWFAYDQCIEQPGRFAPSLGDFIQKVKSHANSVEIMRLKLVESNSINGGQS